MATYHMYNRVATAFFLLCLVTLTSAYSGSLVSFFSVEVYPRPPETFEDMAKWIEDKNLVWHKN